MKSIRRYLTTLRVVLCGAAFVFSQTTIAAVKPHQSIKISLKYSMINDGASIMEKFQIAAAAGFAGIEPNGPMGDEELEQFAEASKVTGVLIPGMICAEGGRAMSSLDESERRKGVELLEQTLRQTKALGGDTVLMYPGSVDKDHSYLPAYEALLKSVRETLPVARETGVKIAMENVWNNIFISPMEVIHFVDAINDPHLGWYFDIGNVARYGWPEQWVGALGKRILKLDIKGYSTSKHMKEGPWAGFNVEIGEDEINWQAVMDELDRTGYSGGWISAEVSGGDLNRLKQVRGQVETVLALP